MRTPLLTYELLFDIKPGVHYDEMERHGRSRAKADALFVSPENPRTEVSTSEHRESGGLPREKEPPFTGETVASERIEFSDSQWQFLAVLEALGEPVPIDLPGTVVPLPPGPMIDLLNRGEGLGLITRSGTDVFGLAVDLPKGIRKRLEKVNTKERLEEMLECMEANDLLCRLNPVATLSLFERAGRHEKAARMEHDLSEDALQNRDYDTAMTFLMQAVEHHSALLGRREVDLLFLSEVLLLSDLCFATGKGLVETPPLLEKAQTVADRLGDLRSRAMTELHLGRFFYFADRRSESFRALSRGVAEVERLGDRDILAKSAEFLGLFFFMQGRYAKAMEHFERAVHPVRHSGRQVLNPTSPFFLAYCASFLGHFHQAIGIMDSQWRRAESESEYGPETIYRALLGNILLMVRMKREGLFHCYGAIQKAAESNNALALYVARAGLSYFYFSEGRIREARDSFEQAYSEAIREGIVRQYGSPWVLEMLFEFHRLGYDPIPAFSYTSQVERAMKEPNVHLRGVAMRLQAREASTRGEAPKKIQALLDASREHLEESGDPTELGKTQLEMARLELSRDRKEEARSLARNAWQGFSGYAEELFPDDLRYLLEGKGRIPAEENAASVESVLQRFLDMMEALIPSPDITEMLTQAVGAINRFLGAERGGLFWFHGDRAQDPPTLRAGVNLTEKEITSEAFRSNLDIVVQSFREKGPRVVRSKPSDQERKGYGVRAILCLPVEVGGQRRGVLYHDNSYLDDCFDFIEGPVLVRLMGHVSLLIDRIWDYARLREEKSREASGRLVESETSETGEIVAQSPVMLRLLRQAEQIARSDSIVLLLGETGVGKELLARKVHLASPRRNKPYVVIDVTTIPENLLESELFGHEKGAFTGADRQKLGRIEAANGGTLFLDEVAELPLSLQSKLLRVLEERAFVRIGGTRVLSSDFRLVTATNRDLAEEVAAGRFREDLYYRLNVVPLTLPPLRDRIEDLPILARHFLRLYVRRFGRSELELTRADEARLAGHRWPGNVRELRNVMERAALLSVGDSVEMNLPADSKSPSSHPFADDPSMDEIQRRYIQHVLEKTGGRVSGPGGAAERLGMHRATLYHRMKKLGLS